MDPADGSPTRAELARENAGLRARLAAVTDDAARAHAAALRESRERLNAALEASGTGTFRWDLRSNELEWDENLDRLFGLPPGQTARSLDAFLALVHPDDRRGVVDHCARCRDAGADFDMEIRVTRPDGTTRWLHDKGRTFRDDGGAPAYMTGACVDVTDRRRGEDALRRSEARLRQLVDAIPQMVWVTRADGYHEFYNRRWYEFTGVPDGTTDGEGWNGMFHPDDQARARVRWAHSLATGEPYEIEYRLRHRDGHYRWVLGRAMPVRHDDGAIARWIGTCTDVHDAKAAQESARSATAQLAATNAALRESDDRFRRLADAMPQIVWTTDAAGRVDYFNQRWVDLTAQPVEQSLGDAWGATVHPDDRAAAVERWAAAVRDGTPFENEHRFRGADGTYRWQLVRGIPVRDAAAGHVVRWFGTCTDVDEQKRTRDALGAAREEAERASRAKDEFLAALSHELRTPLAPVLMATQMIEQDPGLSDESRDDLRMIRRNVEIETRLIDDLLDLTRVARGKVMLRREPTDVHDVLRHAVETCRDDAFTEKGLRLTLDPAAAEHWASADAARLGQIFWNLVKNAAKFTPAGGAITVRTCNPAPGRLAVTVADTGVGIRPDLLPHVFNAFEQGGAHVTRQFGGLGMGLAISRTIAEMHDGTIAAHSDGPGRGATFTVDLPTVAAPAPAPAVDAPVAAGRSAARARVLLVEDHEHTGRIMSRILGRMGYDVHWAQGQVAALDAAADRTFDIVVSDLGLPDGSGHDLMRELRQRYDLPGVALSGYGMEEDVARGRENGFAEHLVKPVSVETLDAVIRQLLA